MGGPRPVPPRRAAPKADDQIPPFEASIDRLTDDQMAGFSAWWALLPSQVGRAEAVAWWADNNPDAETIALIHHATRRALPTWRKLLSEGRRIQLPINWLKARRYEDAAHTA